MIESKILPSNEFWGRRSGKLKHTGRAQNAFATPAFIQQQYGAGSSSSVKKFKRNEKSPNVNHRWFNVSYKSKRTPTLPVKGKKS